MLKGHSRSIGKALAIFVGHGHAFMFLQVSFSASPQFSEGTVASRLARGWAS